MKNTIRFLAISFCALVLSSEVRAENVEIWFKAFIAKDSGRPVPGTDETIVSWQIAEDFLGCFSTDNRGFSDDPKASARVTVRLTLPLSDDTHSFDGQCGVTKKVSCETGEVIETDSCDFKKVFEGKAERISPYARKFHFDVAASNPIPLIAPDIDAEFEITEVRPLPPGGLIYMIKGDVDRFPSFEAYVKYKDKVFPLMKMPPEKGASPASLIGGADVPIDSTSTVFIPR